MSGDQQAEPLGIQPSGEAVAAGSLLKTQSDGETQADMSDTDVKACFRRGNLGSLADEPLLHWRDIHQQWQTCQQQQGR